MIYKWLINFSIGIALASNFVNTPNLGVFEVFGDGARIGYPSPQTPQISGDRSQKTAIGGWDTNEIMEIIAYCESGGKHFGDDGEVLKGKQVLSDRGKFQINALYHNGKAIEMGLDLLDEEDNETYARYLYETQGLKPWKASTKCLQDNFGIEI